MLLERRAQLFEKIVIDTSPRIMAVNKTWTSTMTQYNLTGSELTDWYGFTPDLEGLKATKYWDTETGSCTTEGTYFNLRYYAPNTGGVAFSSRGKSAIYAQDEVTPLTYFSTNRTGEASFYTVKGRAYYCNTENFPIKVSFNLTTADKENSYAYWKAASNTGLLPIGVRNGDIIFAGKNTQYYGKHNIYD